MSAAKPNKIIFITGCMVRGGAERVISVLANHYAQNGYDVEIVMLLKNISEYPLADGVTLTDLSNNSTLPLLFRLIRLYHLVRKEKPYAVISFMARINAAVSVVLKKGRGYRYILSERNDPGKDGRGFFIDALLNRAYRRCDLAVFQTAYAERLAAHGLCKSAVIPNPINLDDVQEGVTAERETFILSAGRFKPQKNQKMLIEAFGIFHKTHPDYVLKIYGFGELENTLKEQVRVSGLENAVFICPSTPHIHVETKRAKMFVMSSNYEGLCNALLEAMSLGTPVVSTNCSGIDEYIIDGENGLLSPVGDAEHFAENLSRLADDDALCTRLSKNATVVVGKTLPNAVFDAWDKALFS